MSSDLHNYGIIGFTADNVGIDRRIYTGLTSTDPVLNVSYNGGRVDVYLNGIKLVGDHSEMPSGTRDYTFTKTGSGSSIQLRTGVALVSADVIECIGHVGLGSNTITTYNYTATSNQTAFTANNVSSDLVNVFLNGILLDSSDYNLNTSNTVTLASGASASDIVHIQVIGALDNSNFVPVGGGTFTGDVSVNGNTNLGDGGNDQVKITNSNSFSHTAFTAEKPALTIESTSESTANYGPYLTLYRNSTAGSPTPNATKAGAIDWRLNQSNSSNNGYDNDQQYMRMGLDAINVNNGVQACNFYINKRIGNTRETVLQIATNQNLELPKTNQLIKMPAGGGIWFQNYNFNPSSNPYNLTVSSNLLDDYEEGTWTPTLTPNTGSFTNISTQHATYTKIGRLVTLTMKITISNKGTAQGGLNITNIPYIPLHETAIAGEIMSTGGTYVGYVDPNGTIYTYPGTYVNAYQYTISATFVTS